jgi:hypothetical protein
MSAGFNQRDKLCVVVFPRMCGGRWTRHLLVEDLGLGVDNGVRNHVQILQTNDALISHAAEGICEFVGGAVERKS